MTSLAYSQFARLALGGKPVIKQHDILPDTKSPGVAVTNLFLYQSYFDSTLLEKALLAQSNNEPIVGSTLRQEQIGGYALALHPSSQTPVAVQPLVGGQSASQQAVILRPGQIFRPYGRPGDLPGNFSGFRWGLPFGWLGGGQATLYVLPSPDAKVDWDGSSPEIIFHRQRMQILAPAALTSPTRFNWPTGFPWTQALRGATSIPQKGAAVITVSPTRVLVSLRLTALAASNNEMRFVFQATDDFDLDSAGAVILSPQRFVDVAWPIYTNAGAAGLTTQYPVMEITGPAMRLAADDGGVQLMDLNAGTLTNAYVDVVRYGCL